LLLAEGDHPRKISDDDALHARKAHGNYLTSSYVSFLCWKKCDTITGEPSKFMTPLEVGGKNYDHSHHRKNKREVKVGKIMTHDRPKTFVRIKV